MSNCAPVLVVDGVGEVGEAPGDVEGTVLPFFGPQPAIPNTITAADSVRTAAAAIGRDELSVLCMRMLLTPPRD
jgi:hypothetical protein